MNRLGVAGVVLEQSGDFVRGWSYHGGEHSSNAAIYLYLALTENTSNEIQPGPGVHCRFSNPSTGIRAVQSSSGGSIP